MTLTGASHRPEAYSVRPNFILLHLSVSPSTRFGGPRFQRVKGLARIFAKADKKREERRWV